MPYASIASFHVCVSGVNRVVIYMGHIRFTHLKTRVVFLYLTLSLIHISGPHPVRYTGDYERGHHYYVEHNLQCVGEYV